VLGVARRTATLSISKVTWAAADVADDDLTKLFEGADVVVHLAWLIQPSRRLDVLHRTNLLGSRRVFEAVEAARVGALVYASSVGTYAAGHSLRAPRAWRDGKNSEPASGAVRRPADHGKPPRRTTDYSDVLGPLHEEGDFHVDLVERELAVIPHLGG
jgi:nucleoside-diphosphate-sugar epimerase